MNNPKTRKTNIMKISSQRYCFKKKNLSSLNIPSQTFAYAHIQIVQIFVCSFIKDFSLYILTAYHVKTYRFTIN